MPTDRGGIRLLAEIAILRAPRALGKGSRRSSCAGHPFGAEAFHGAARRTLSHFCGWHGDGQLLRRPQLTFSKDLSIGHPLDRSGWALGLGRVGAIVGPAIGGVLLALGFGGHGMFIVAGIPIAIVTLLMPILWRSRRNG